MFRESLIILLEEYKQMLVGRAFLLTTLLLPILLIIGMVGIGYVVYLSTKEFSYDVQVLDRSNLLDGRLEDTKRVHFTFIENKSLTEAKNQIEKAEDYLLWVEPAESTHTEGSTLEGAEITLYGKKLPSQTLQRQTKQVLSSRYYEHALAEKGLSVAFLDSMRKARRISLAVQALVSPYVAEEEGPDEAQRNRLDLFKSKVAGVIGIVLGFVMYIMVLIYASSIQKRINQEKESRIAELMLCSVRPFSLLFGKISALGLLGATQVFIWTTLLFMALVGLAFFVPLETILEQVLSSAEQTGAGIAASGMNYGDLIWVLDIPLLAGAFVLYLILGYLLYGGLFALIGASISEASEAGKFNLPLILPLILTTTQISVVSQAPDISIARWLSFIPFTSPVIMPVRMAHGVLFWELGLSLVLLLLGVIISLWLAGRVYRIGILMQGTKANYLTIWRWLWMKG